VKLLDTTVAIDHLRGDRAAVDLLRGLVENDEMLAASEVVRFELVAGVGEDELPALEQFFSALFGWRSGRTLHGQPGKWLASTAVRVAGSMTPTTSSLPRRCSWKPIC
jgi:hypothetical protein